MKTAIKINNEIDKLVKSFGCNDSPELGMRRPPPPPPRLANSSISNSSLSGSKLKV